MPHKSRRIASRQAELSRRRHKARHAVAPPAQGPAAAASGNVASQQVAAQAPQAVKPTAVPGAPTPTPAAPRWRAASRGRGLSGAEALPPASQYVGPELRRIAILTAAIAVVLVVLTLVLK